MALWLVRHAAPRIAPGLCYGRLDIPAEEAATRRAAEQLDRALPPRIRVRASPLDRCASLARALSEMRPGLEVGFDPRLMEMDFGAWEGRPWNDIGREALDAWRADFAAHRPGGGESVDAFMQRVAEAFDDLAKQPPTDAERGTDDVWITHAGVIRAACILASGVRRVDDASHWPVQAPSFGGWTLLPAARRESTDPQR